MQLPYDFYNRITYTYCNPEFRCAQALSGIELEEFEVFHLISETTYDFQADFDALISNNPESLKILMCNIRSIPTMNSYIIIYKISFMKNSLSGSVKQCSPMI